MRRTSQAIALVLLLVGPALADSTNSPISSPLIEPALCVARLRSILEEVRQMQVALTNNAVALDCVRAKLGQLQTITDVSEAGLRKLRILEQAAPDDEQRIDEERARIYVSYGRAERLAVQALDCLPPAVRTNAVVSQADGLPKHSGSTVALPATTRRLSGRSAGPCISQGETARLIALAMELVIDAREETIACAELAQKGIAPPGGWRPPQCLSVEDFYVIAAKALHLKPEKEDDPLSSAQVLRAAGLPVDTLLPPQIPGRQVAVQEAELRAFLAAGRGAGPGR